ncbi:MAG: metalloregulator ArsR/SmtB family transcription factor [Gammaproteobacteria bacterium]|nr:metalloregulator ArsR/SmtB family transcription factor [Gammaproteobacteria bacterium]
MIGKEQILGGLKAAGEPTRLRLLALCAQGELSVSELTHIVGQSQPRVSRHLKMLVEAGLLDRFREGAMVFYRLSERGEAGDFAHMLVNLLPDDDEELLRDRSRLEEVKARRAELALHYFSENAERWNEIRSLHVREDDVEEALMRVIGDEPIEDFLDIGTGTGRILVLVAPQVTRGMGLDISTEMLNIARDSFEQQGLRNVHVRKGDMYNMPIENSSIDVATLHQVLHYSQDAGRVIAETARVLKPDGRLIVVDFAPHHEEHLRHEHQHYRLGFSDAEIDALFSENGLQTGAITTLEGDPLTVKIWQARRNVAH